ncbi:unnamed protein product [Fusarium graminearum]|uniref:Chromosome 3, complete genome n=1 Tax=Gibberella zeae (strain ATCC MYA-4620 / CBS 123657 / FGSC 9075 / NRRL 31084 / PH-1) TaxID=229533 RepID=A0A098E459_GIBZE|nr:unnamed protein product [Fusarium graminearum]CZS84395.1 unnamed protein product [Fusarium graminearum]
MAVIYAPILNLTSHSKWPTTSTVRAALASKSRYLGTRVWL